MDNSNSEAKAAVSALIDVMARLRTPETGCPWDLEQDFRTIAPYTIEEAYEVADAIERNDMSSLKEELGDLLLQTVFHARMAEEENLFDFADVAQAITDKMVRRHPHVFGDADARDEATQTEAWETQKAAERSAKGQTSIFDDVPVGMPALARAVKIQKRAARVGFDWPDADGVIEKIREETVELSEAMAVGDRNHVEEELGDLLSAVANMARYLKIDPEAALRASNEKFMRRFRHIETALGNGLEDANLDEMEALWGAAKAAEKKDKS